LVAGGCHARHGGGALIAELFAEEAVIGEGTAQDLDDALLALAIRARDRRPITLDLDGEPRAEISERHLSGGPCGIDRGL
jgi:hypothetical protein